MRSAKASNRFMLIFVLYFFAAAVAIAFIPHLDSLSTGALQVISQLIVFIAPCAAVAIIFKENLREIFPLKGIGAGNVLLIIILCVLIQPFMMFVSGLSSLFFENTISETINVISDEQSFLSTIFILAVTPAVCEELLMRGVVYSGYRNTHILKAALVNGVFFGVMHFNAQQFFYAFFFGIFFVLLVRCTGSILSSMLAHFSINALQASLSYWQRTLPAEPALEEAATRESIIQAVMALGVIALVLMPVFVLVFYMFAKYNKNRSQAREQEQEQELASAPQDEPDKLNEISLPERKDRVLTLSFFATIILYIIFIGLTSK